MVNFEIVSCSSFRGSPDSSFCDGDVGDGSGGVNAICSPPEIPDDIVYSEDVYFRVLRLYKNQ